MSRPLYSRQVRTCAARALGLALSVLCGLGAWAATSQDAAPIHPCAQSCGATWKQGKQQLVATLDRLLDQVTADSDACFRGVRPSTGAAVDTLSPDSQQVAEANLPEIEALASCVRIANQHGAQVRADYRRELAVLNTEAYGCYRSCLDAQRTSETR